MSWRDLPPFPDEMYEPEKPKVTEGEKTIVLTFHGDLDRQWYAAWLKSKRSFEQYGDWVDERR